MNGKKKEVKDVNTKRMSNFVGLIARLRQDDKQTLGRFYLFNGLDVVVSGGLSAPEFPRITSTRRVPSSASRE